MWMPASGWNGKYHHAGNGGYGGTLPTSGNQMLGGLWRGYAVAGTDMGHNAAVTPGGSFALGHPEKIVDWASRANHVTAVAAKLIIKAFYGATPRLSYFQGCSDGGHEALMEAQRFPDDFDGIIAGASADYWTHQSAAWVWEARAALDDPASYIPLTKLPIVTQAAAAACPGVVPGVIDDPTRCNFDPIALLCSGADAPTCLTAAQVGAVRKIYAGPRNPRTRERIYPGLERGSEASQGLAAGSSWSALIGGPQTFLGGDFYKYMVFGDPTWDFHTLDFDRDIAFADAKMAPIVDSTSADLSDFKALGGKLIMYHGWADPLVNSRNSINYYESVVVFMDRHDNDDSYEDAPGFARQTEDFIRLFMAPGMAHCRNGPGLNTFDTLTALEKWVEEGIAPKKIIAYHNSTAAWGGDAIVTGVPSVSWDMSRPLCPYPKVAHWNGKGSPRDAGNFACVREPSPGRDNDD
jgi:feruloyl esterase